MVVRYLDDVLNGSNPESAFDLVACDVVRRRATTMRTAFPDLAVRTQQLLAEGALVAVHLSGGGTHEGVFQGCPGTGRRWTATCSAIYRIEAGQIAEGWVNWDLLAILEQLGVIRRADTVSA